MQGLYNGKSSSPNEDVLAPLMKHLLESMMDGELVSHPQEDKASGISNSRNGKTKKTVRGLNTVTFELESGRDRSGTFEPKVVPKRQVIITEQLEGHVLSMYTKGMSTRAISDFIREIYAMKISASEISDITNNIILDKNYETIYH
ncbi:transposase [Sphingobacterium faecium]